MRRSTFTLIEILIVMVVIGLVLAVAAPRIARRSQRMTVENALTAIRTAVNETAMRARATGQPLTLTLNTDENELAVATADDQSLERSWTPPRHDSDDDDDDGKTPSFIQAKPSYTLPKDIQWTPDDDNFDDDGAIVFHFFPDGQAAGHEIAFTVSERNFTLRIDRITADPVILEILE